MALHYQLHLLPFNKKPIPLLSSSSSSLTSFLALQQRTIAKVHPLHCLSTSSSSSSVRRTANYRPTIWDDNYIQSLPIDFKEENYANRMEELKTEVRHLIGQQDDLVEQLELVDTICQLGLDYHFDIEIKNLLSYISSSMEHMNSLIENSNLHGSALLFRLQREHGIANSSLRVNDLINCIKEVRGSIILNHQHHVKGLLSLYEASFLTIEGEEELYEAGKFAIELLRNLDICLLSPQLVEKIKYATEIPLHWRMSRLHTRSFINAYERQENVNTILLELAKLDFNLLQSTHKIELQEISRWWRNLHLVHDELNFARDRLVENYLWALGITFQPKFGKVRNAITKIICLTVILDDIYDIYGTFDELKIFTNAIEEWKMVEAQLIPDCMKRYLIALFDTMHDIASSFLMERKLDILPCLKKVWADLCKAFLLEAKWYHYGYTPTMDEYLENAWITIGGICPIIISYYLSDDLITNTIDSLEFYPPIHYSCMLLRLYDDLGTITEEIERGDVSKSIQCYMKENNVSESTARDYSRSLINNYWKKVKSEMHDKFKKYGAIQKFVLNLPRTAQCFYQYEMAMESRIVKLENA